jgi:hypothetical protein
MKCPHKTEEKVKQNQWSQFLHTRPPGLRTLHFPLWEKWKCPHVNPSEILPPKCPAGCGHSIYSPRRSSKCPHNAALFCQMGGGRSKNLLRRKPRARLPCRIATCCPGSARGQKRHSAHLQARARQALAPSIEVICGGNWLEGVARSTACPSGGFAPAGGVIRA